MERVLLHLGPFPVYTFGVTIAAGFLAGLWLAGREAKRLGLDLEQVMELALGLMAGGIIGARLFYVLAYDPGFYLANPGAIPKIYEGGLSIHGGIIGAVLIGLWQTRRLKLDFWPTADIFAPSVILAQAIARIGCDVFGVPMQNHWPWGVIADGVLVHPVQIYETFLDLGLFLFLWGKRHRRTYPGQLFAYYLGGYALIRFVLEFFRTNPVLFGPITPAHLTSAAFVVLATILGRRQARRASRSGLVASVPRYWVSPKMWLSVVLVALTGAVVFYGVAL